MSNENPAAESNSAKKLSWWKTPRAAKAGKVAAGVVVFSIAVWFFLFRPYVGTDDARVAVTMIRLAPEGVSGKVTALNVKEGDQVQKDAVLVELDHRQVEANLSKAKARAKQAEVEMKRMQQLAAQNGVPPRDLDNATANAEIAKADLDLAQIAYDRTFLKSPVDGVVVQKNAEIGNILEINQTAVTVADIEHAWVSANIEETSVGLIKVGQRVTIKIDEGGKLTGKVSDVRSATASQFALIQAENPSGNFTKLVQRVPIKVELDPHPDHALRAGQSVVIKIKVH
jgi:membrane fusion protein (multidrug efflux system)